jgi:hypothetical protein
MQFYKIETDYLVFACRLGKFKSYFHLFLANFATYCVLRFVANSLIKKRKLMFHLLNIIGTIAFAMSGALTAISKKSLLVFVPTFVTAVGGTLRDVMIGRTPYWMQDLDRFM